MTEPLLASPFESGGCGDSNSSITPSTDMMTAVENQQEDQECSPSSATTSLRCSTTMATAISVSSSASSLSTGLSLDSRSWSNNTMDDDSALRPDPSLASKDYYYCSSSILRHDFKQENEGQMMQSSHHQQPLQILQRSRAKCQFTENRLRIQHAAIIHDSIPYRTIMLRRIAISAIGGGLLGGLLGVLLLSIVKWNNASLLIRSPSSCTSRTCSYSSTWMTRGYYEQQSLFSNTIQGVYAYLDLFDAPWKRQPIIQQENEGTAAATSTTTKPRPPTTLSSLKQQGQRRNLKDDNAAPPINSSSSSNSSISGSSSNRQGGNSSSSAGGKRGPTLVIAGKMTVEDAPCNIAQYDLVAGDWSLSERIQLSLYNSYSGGEVYSLLANYTTSDLLPPEGGGVAADNSTATSSSSGMFSITKKASSSSSPPASSSSTSKTTQTTSAGSGALIVVGAFDTTYREQQKTYCSVGVWDGLHLSKVGEGLCNSALSKGMKITTAAFAGPQDVYVAGSFQTQVWKGDRHEFVKIFNIAHFNAVDQVWLPLNIGQITCSWCTVTVLALAWDSKRRQLHVAGKFNSIDGRNVPAGLAIYDYDTGHLVAHPGGGLTMRNISQDGVGTALQLDEESGVLYVMGSFERLTATYEICLGLAAYEIEANRWTCLADAAHTVLPTGGGNMLLTPYGLMVGGKTTSSTTWPDSDRPYTIALLKTTLQRRQRHVSGDDDSVIGDDDAIKNQYAAKHDNAQEDQYHDFNWSWLPGFEGHDEPLHALANGFGPYKGTVFIAGDNLVAKWHYVDQEELEEIKKKASETSSSSVTKSSTSTTTASSSTITQTEDATSSPTDTSETYDEYTDTDEEYTEMNEDHRRLLNSYIKDIRPPMPPILVPTTEILSNGHVRGAIMAISQMMPEPDDDDVEEPEVEVDKTAVSVNITIIVYCVSAGCVIGVIGAILCNRNITSAIFPFLGQERDLKGFTLDTLTYSALENTNIMDAYRRAMETRYVQHPHLLTIIDPQEIFLQRIIGEGTFGRVWSAKWRSASVAVKEFVFAQAAVAGRSSMQQEIVEEIIGEAGMMAILRHPNVLQLFGCSLTAQAIWIVSELCSLGSLRQLLDDNDRSLSVERRLSLALQVAEGMTYLHNQDPPIIHRDLKSHNIFVHETFTDSEDLSVTSDKQRKGKGLNDHYEKIESHSTMVAKIGDWGSARATLSGSRTMTHGVGTACWLAPEVIKHARSSKFSDVYGYGIVLWELATREEVYQGLETTQIIAKVANENLRPPIPQTCPWKDLMVKCWAENPMDRLEFSEIVAELTRLSKAVQEENKQHSSDGQSASSDDR